MSLEEPLIVGNAVFSVDEADVKIIVSDWLLLINGNGLILVLAAEAV